MKKKIFFIMSTNDYSGAEAVNFSIIDGLKDKYNFTWVSRKGNINYFLKKNNINWIEIKKLSVSEIKRVIKKYKPDIIHATDFKASVISSQSTRKIPIISHLHHNAPWIKKLSMKSILFFVASKRINKILTVSNAIKNDYIFSSLLKEKIKVVGNPVSREKIINKVDLNQKIKEYDICCVARLSKPKNPFRFVDIINQIKKQYKNIKCVWVGTGELKNEVIYYAEKMGVIDNIDYVGFKDNPYTYMNKSKIFMMTSDWEGYGLVAFEALCLGLPCVVSNVGGLTDIVDNSCGKTCNPSNIKEYINEVNELLKNVDYYNEKSNNAKIKSLKLSNLDDYLNQIDTCYKQL